MIRSVCSSLSRSLLALPIFALIGLAGLPATARGQGLEGPWLMSVTLRDCVSSAPLGPPFLTLLTFHAGGTLSESAASAGFAPGQRGPGHGAWRQTGAATFAARFAALIAFETAPNPPAPGFKAGGLLVTASFTQTGPSALTALATADFYDATLTKYRSACPTIVGQRLP